MLIFFSSVGVSPIRHSVHGPMILIGGQIFTDPIPVFFSPSGCANLAANVLVNQSQVISGK